MGVNVDKMTDEEILEVMNRIQKVIMANHDKTRDEIVELIVLEMAHLRFENDHEALLAAYNFKVHTDMINRNQVVIVGGSVTGKALSSLAYDEIVRNHIKIFDESWMGQEGLLTNKQRMLSGRPDLLKEGWRQKGNRRK